MDAKSLREAMKEKAKRLSGATSEKVDASTFTPAEPLNADVKTGARPISRRLFNVGGKVAGAEAMTHAGRTPRKAGGKVEYANALVNRNVRDANEEREGKKHIGAFKSGGRIAKMGGGLADLKKRVRMTDDGYENDPYRRIYSDDSNPMKPSKAKLAEGQALLEEDQRYMGDMTRRKNGGKTEGSAKDMMEDKKLAKKHGMTMKEWEASSADKKHDMPSKKMSGGSMGYAAGGKLKMVEKDGKKVPDFAADGIGKMKSGGRTAKMGGGGMGMGMQTPMMPMAGGYKKGGKAMHHKGCMCKACGGSAMKDGGGLYANINAKRERIENGSKEKMRKVGSKGAPTADAFKDSAKTAEKKDGGKAMHHKDCMCKACGGAAMSQDGGRTARATGGKVGKSNISINIFPHNAEKAGAMPVPPAGMPPMGAPPMMRPPMPAPSPMPSAPPPAHMSLPPGLMAAMSGAAGAGPTPPAGGPPMPPMMARKAGGKVVYPITGGAGGGKARKEKVEAYGEKMNKDLRK
jgi:hypothetical protein